MDQAQYDELLSNLRTGKSGLSGPESKNYVVEGEKLYYRDSDKDGKNDLLVVTVNNKNRVLESCHSQGEKHLDKDKTLGEVSKQYYWPKMLEDVEEFCLSCEQCQKANRSSTAEQTEGADKSLELESSSPAPSSEGVIKQAGRKFWEFLKADTQPSTLSELCVRGDKVAIRSLLEDPDTNVNETDSKSETPLHKVCSTGNTEVIKLLLEQDGIDIWRKSNHGKTPLHVASECGCVEAAELLLGTVSDENEVKHYVNMPDSRGLTPLCYLAKLTKDVHRSEIMVKFLQERGADLGISLKCAAKCGKWTTKDAGNLVRLCGGLKSNWDELLEAIRDDGGKKYCSITDANNNTLLHVASKLRGQTENVKEIIRMCKAIIDAENSNLKTPLHLAIENGNTEIIDVLLEHNATVKGSKMTPLHVAMKQTSAGYPIEHVVETLLRRQPPAFNVNSRDVDDQSPLHYAAVYCNDHPHVINLLLDSGARLDIQDKEGVTPLMLAAIKKRERTFDAMVKTEAGIRLVKQTLLNPAQGQPQRAGRQSTVGPEHLEALLPMLKTTEFLSCTDDSGNTPLHIAAKHNHVGAVSLLLTKGADCNRKNHMGRTPLHLASASGCNKAVQVLMDDTNCDILSQDNERMTPLHMAAEQNMVDVLKLVLKKCVDCNIGNSTGKTPLHLAAEKGYEKNVQALIGKDTCKVSSEDNDGMTPLHIACQNGHTKVIQILLARGADIDHRNVNRCTPLNLAVKAKHKETVRLLMSNGASFLRSFISTAEHQEEAAAMIEICGDAEVKKATFEAVRIGRDEPLEFLQTLANHTGTKYLIEPIDPDNNTPLHLAAMHGHFEIVKILLETKPKKDTVLSYLWPWGNNNKEIQVNAENRCGETPLHLAAGKGHPQNVASGHSHKDVISILLDHGAKISSTKEEGCTPIHIAVMKEFTEGVKVLLEKRPECVNYTDKQQRTPLHYAGEHCHKAEIIAILIEGKGDLEAMDKNDLTPVLTAAAYENDDAFNIMVEKGHEFLKTTLFQAAKKPDATNIHALQRIINENQDVLMEKDESGFTVLHIACQMGHLNVVKVIESHLDPDKLQKMYDICDKEGNTLLHLACQSNSRNVVLHLLNERSAEIDARSNSKDEEAPLYVAAQLLVATNNKGEAPAHIAAQLKSIDIIKLLLDKGDHSLIELKDHRGCTPLHHAAENNQPKIITFLHQLGANNYAEDQALCTPVLTAVAHKKIEAFHCLMKLMDFEDEQKNPIFKVLRVKENKAEMLKFLVADSTWGPKLVKSTDSYGNSVLHVTARENDLSAMTVLMELQVKSDIKNVDGKTPMHLAAEKGHQDAVLQLMEHNSKLVESKDNCERTPLHLACLHGHINIVQVHKSHHLHLRSLFECHDAEGNTALHLACSGGNIGIVELLIDSGADIKAINIDKETPLHIAIHRGHVHTAKLLLMKKAPTECQTVEGHTPLHYAARANNSELITELVKSGADLNSKDNNYCTPTHIAAMHQYTEAYQCLMKCIPVVEHPSVMITAFDVKCNRNIILEFLVEDLCHATDKSGNTPLHIASECGNLEAVKFLLDHRANANAQNHEGEIPMHLAAGKGIEHVVQHLIGHDPKLMLCKDSGGKTPLHTACQHGQTEIAKIYIEIATDILELTDTNGNTPLHLACEGGNVTLIQLLLDNGARITATNTRGWAPVHIAAQHKSVEIVELLLDKGDHTSIELKDVCLCTPLHHAAGKNQSEIITFLHERGANIYAEDQSLCTPVLTAAAHNKVEAFNCLMQFIDLEDDQRNPIFKALHIKELQAETLKFLIADPTWGPTLIKFTDKDENSVLHIAVSKNNLLAVTVLVEHGVESNVKNVDGKTPLHLAAENGYQEIAHKLIDSNPSLLKSIDNEGKSPLHLACQHGHLTVVQDILESPHCSKNILEACEKQENTSMHLASMGGCSDIVKLLIDKGANTNAKNVNRKTPLHCAAEYGFVDVVTVLVQKQKDSEHINCWDDCKRTPLHLAAKNNHVAVIKCLQNHLQQQTLDPNIPDLHVEDKFSYTPVILTAEDDSREAFQFFMNCIGEDGIKDVTSNPLFQALDLHDKAPPAVKFMIDDSDWGVKLCSVTNDEGHTLLHMAAKKGLPVIVEELLKHQLTKEMRKDVRGLTPLHLACQEGHHEVVIVLEPHLSAEDLIQKDRERNTALHLACEGGEEETVKLLLDVDARLGGGELINERNVRGEVPIHIAVRYGYESMVQLLLEKGGKLDTADDHGCTPLHHAARNDQEKMIQFLCERNPDLINCEDHDGHTPILTAASRSKVKAFQCLMSYQQHLKVNPVFKALESKENPVAILKLMLSDPKWGSKLRRDTDSAGNTPLHVAAKHGSVAAIKLLLEGDSVSSEMYLANNSGKTPMHMAAEGGHVHVVGELILYQSNTKELKDGDMNTPLHLACMNGHTEVARMLLTARLLFEKNDQGNTPLHLACMRKGNVGIVRELIAAIDSDAGEVNSLLNERNAGNQTPLDLAYQEEDPDISIVLYLIENGANVGLKPVFNGVSETHPDFNFLDLAIERKHRDIAMKIVESDYWNEALRSCHVITGEDHPPAVDPQGPFPAVDPQGPSPAVDPQALIVVNPLALPAVNPHLPPEVDPQDPSPPISPPSPSLEVDPEALPAVNPQIPPPKGDKQGPSPAVNPPSPPPAVSPQDPPPIVNAGHSIETTPMRELIKEMPDVAEKVLDRCTENKEYVYEFLEDFKPVSWPCFKRCNQDDIEGRSQDENDHWGPKSFEYSNHPLSIMVKYRCSELLKHKLVSSFLRQKSTFGAAFYLAEFFLYVLFLVFLTVYALIVPTPLDDICAANASELLSNTTQPLNPGATNASELPSNITQPLNPDQRQYTSTSILAIFTIVFAAIGLLLQFWTFCTLMIRYCVHLKDSKWYSNLKDILSRSFLGTIRFLMFVFAIVFASVNFQCPRVTNTQWQFGALAVFFGWINMITYIKLVPRIGVYVLMFQNVIYSFLKIFILGLLLIVAFGLAFYMLFRIPSEMRSPFATPGLAFVKTLTADFDFDEIFRLSDDEDEIAYVGASYFMWIVFVIIMVILFQNLLTSVAVGDIQEIRENAQLKQRELHVELLLNFEELFPQTVGNLNEQQNSHKTFKILEWMWKLASGASEVEEVHPLEHRLEQALGEIDSIKQILRDHSRKVEDTESIIKRVEGHQEVHENLAQRTSEKLDSMKEQLLEKIEQLNLKLQQPSAAAH